MVGKHAIERMKLRCISKGELGYNLRKRPLLLTPIRYDDKGRPSYQRYTDNQVMSAINPDYSKVVTTRKYHEKDLIKLIGRIHK
jgi:hypothetical protein